METPPLPTQKKGLGPLAWIGIGCGGIIVLAIIAVVVASFIFGPKAKEFIQNAQKDPTRATATLMVSVGGGQIEMVAQDEENKRYTVRDKRTGKMTTIYWNEKKHATETVEGDFSAIPASPEAPVTSDAPAIPSPAEPAPATPEPAPATEPK
ncbi:MAG: hypothetical protein JWL90_164 [Chthoniobacteraceae bacterium]|nr:hypothetical protein [Chthoniobacteraceae bacterium]